MWNNKKKKEEKEIKKFFKKNREGYYLFTRNNKPEYWQIMSCDENTFIVKHFNDVEFNECPTHFSKKELYNYFKKYSYKTTTENIYKNELKKVKEKFFNAFDNIQIGDIFHRTNNPNEICKILNAVEFESNGNERDVEKLFIYYEKFDALTNRKISEDTSMFYYFLRYSKKGNGIKKSLLPTIDVL